MQEKKFLTEPISNFLGVIETDIWNAATYSARRHPVLTSA